MCMWVNTFQVQCHLSIMFICNESVGGESVSLLKEGESESPFMFVIVEPGIYPMKASCWIEDNEWFNNLCLF